MKKIYEIQVKDDGEFQPIKLRNGNVFFTRSEAMAKMREYKNRFPHRITTRVRPIG